MSLQLVAGGVRLVAYYSAFGRHASMVFYFRSYEAHPPTVSECRAVADAYGLWENNGIGIGYSLLRSDDSHYINVSCRALQGVGGPEFTDTGFDRAGQVPGFVSPMLGTGLSPICRWATAERGERTGRTYLVGISEGITSFGSDQEYLGPDAGATIQLVMAGLAPLVLAATGYTQAHYTESPRGGLPTGPKLLDITGSGVYNLLGSRRNRTRQSSSNVGLPG